MAASIDTINGRVNALAGVKSLQDIAKESSEDKSKTTSAAVTVPLTPAEVEATPSSPTDAPPPVTVVPRQTSSSSTSRIILTTYPGQSGIDPVIMNWGAKDPAKRGPVVVSRAASTVRRRNGMLCTLQFASFLGHSNLLD